MASVGVITYHESINYGAILQAYALQKVLLDMGHTAELVDYQPRRGVAAHSRYRQIRNQMWRFIATVLAGNGREIKTAEFRNKFLKKSSQSYPNRDELQRSPPLYDAYITGSDQVWNPVNNSNDPSYFLSFAPEGKKRISYAASFGVSRLNETFVDNYRKWLLDIHNISVREKEGFDIVKSLTARDAEVVLDPTLLVNQEHWREIAGPNAKTGSYILCYYMPGDKKVNQCITKIASSIARLTGWGIVNIGQKEYMRLVSRRRSVFDVGPEEFLSLFNNASFVVTNSFHGTAFAINFCKPFIVPVNQGIPREKKLSSRIESLLTDLELTDCLLPLGSPLPDASAISCDFTKSTLLLEKKKRDSLAFLENSLKDVEN